MSATTDRLTQIVDSVDHDDLENAVTQEDGGLLGALDEVFALLVSEFNPAKAKGRSGRFQFEVGAGASTIAYYVHVENGTCSAAAGEVAEPNIVIGIKFADMLLMGLGRLPGARAFMTGKLKLRGNPLFGTKLGDWFDHPPV